MVGRLFSRQRIRGVSFRHGRSSPASRRPAKTQGDAGSPFNWGPLSFSDSPWSGPSVESIRNSAPRPFKKTDVHRLLADYGRNELHTLVSETIEHLVQLRQLSQSFRRFVPDVAPDRKFLEPDVGDETVAHPLQETGIEIMRVQRLWKHRLEMLEMIAMAQDSLRNFGVKSPKMRPPQAGEFVPRQK